MTDRRQVRAHQGEVTPRSSLVGLAVVVGVTVGFWLLGWGLAALVSVTFA